MMLYKVRRFLSRLGYGHSSGLLSEEAPGMIQFFSLLHKVDRFVAGKNSSHGS